MYRASYHGAYLLIQGEAKRSMLFPVIKVTDLHTKA